MALATIPGQAIATDSRSPFKWTTMRDMTYTFCYNASGPYRPDALAVLARTKLFIHGMNERQTEEPVFKQSEAKVIAAAAQLRAVNPEQQQFYTITHTGTNALYASGDWFNAHPECLLRDANGSVVNHTAPKANIPICTDGPNKDLCHMYGFQTECGREAWVKFAVDTVTKGNLDGVFIDGFQGCSPDGCPGALANCSDLQQKAWLQGLNTTLWELHRQLKAKGNKTIICNGTGKMWACGGKTPCFCDAANKERFYPGENDLAQVVDSAQDQDGLGHPFWGIIHVPHVNEKRASFNKSLAGFLATAGGAGTPFGYGVGFEYDCEQGGWLREYAELDQSVGPPAGPPKITNMSGGGGRGPTTAIFTRRYASGVRAFFNASNPPSTSSSCVAWSDGSRTESNGGCAQMHAWRGTW